MFKNIIVPVEIDRAEEGRAMLAKVKDLLDEGGKVTITNVVEDVPGLITAELPDGLVEKAARNAKSTLVEMAKEAGVEADVQIRSGRPHHAIVGLAEEIGSDLILIPSHNPGMRDYLLGSTAANVVRHANCSVLVCRSGHAG